MKTAKTTKSKITKTAKKASDAPAVVAPVATIARAQSVAVTKAKVDPAPTAITPRRQITKDLIATRAYIIWEQQGCPQGHDVANWLLAERQLQQEIQSFTA